MAIGATEDFHGLTAARFFLGFAEAPVSPVFIIITSNWYKRREHPIRVAAWISMNGISQIVGALLMYAVGGADMAIESWRAIFLIFGGLTVACGAVFLWLCPMTRRTLVLLNGDQRLRLQQLRTMLLGTPGGEINFATVWISALGPRIFPNTRIYTSVLLAVPVDGAGNAWAMVAATWLASCSSALLSGAASLMASNVKGNTKKSVVSAGFFIFLLRRVYRVDSGVVAV
ncbi:hypothetical protein ACHAQH_008846 [Verticillium albo-atrum]